MFNRILIANRGEIACRIIRTAKKMAIETIAVYSSVDKDADHVKQADRAYCIGEAAANASYLNIDAIINAALETKAEAIHPGYGFLSENPTFAQACEDAGIVFIGPSIDAMKAMASKQLAKQLLEKTSVPLTPGYHGSEQSNERLLKEAKAIGFPVLIKAASGGGGKGMRAVFETAEFIPSLEAARREALASFADDTMIIEKLVIKPRHVEIQVMADNHGQTVHLFERDCSVQRRHQKIIEEAPAPKLSDTLRQGLAKAACEVAKSIDYRGAGTVEFLVSEDEAFYFMEMNTRLQVEHPVTEMITGLDLVAWQIKIAANEPLPCKQRDIKAHGHAIECRIYAEDPLQNFMPSIGQIDFLKEPDAPGIRIDSGVRQGSDISMYYDPMIAKLIAWGEDRSQALRRLQQALNQYYISGVKTNIPFLQAVCQNEAFIQADLNTDFLNQHTIELQYMKDIDALKIAVAHDYLKAFKKLDDPIYQDCFSWQMNLSGQWHWRYLMADKTFDIQILAVDQNQLILTLENESIHCFAELTSQGLILNDGQNQLTAVVKDCETGLTIFSREGQARVERFNWNRIDAQASQQKGQLTSPMPATVVAVLKKIGESVKTGDKLMVLEAMKMEHTIHAPKDGVLTHLFYNVGAQVKEGAELLSLEERPPE